jgi:hypothetical protein
MRIALFFLITGLAFAADELKPVAETRTFELAPDGTIHIQNAAGNIQIDAWDQPRVELTTVKTAEEKKVMDEVKVSGEASGNTLTISTAYHKYPKIERPFRWTLNFDLEYRIKAPRNAKLVIDEYAGEVNINGMTGDIHATDGNGNIFLLLPDGNYGIDAHSKLGAVISDFPGKEKLNPLLLGHDFKGPAETARKLYLHVGFGDVMILKMRTPALAD